MSVRLGGETAPAAKKATYFEKGLQQKKGREGKEGRRAPCSSQGECDWSRRRVFQKGKSLEHTDVEPGDLKERPP